MSLPCGWAAPLNETGFVFDRSRFFPWKGALIIPILRVCVVLRWSDLEKLALLCMYYVLESDITDNSVAFLCSTSNRLPLTSVETPWKMDGCSSHWFLTTNSSSIRQQLDCYIPVSSEVAEMDHCTLVRVV